MSALPPYAAVLGVSVEPGEAGSPVLLMPFSDDVVGRPGFLHGGALAGLLELAAIAALQAALDAHGGGRIKPITVTVDFMRGGRDAPTRAVGTVTRMGSRIANVQAVAWQEDRAKPIAAARLNYRIVREDILPVQPS